MWQIKADVIRSLQAYVSETPEVEVCGYLAGQGSLIDKAYPLTNVHVTPQTRYSFSPSEQFMVMRLCREEKRQIVGVFHSHPHSLPYPSFTDVTLCADEDYVWFILTPHGESGLYQIQASCVSSLHWERVD